MEKRPLVSPRPVSVVGYIRNPASEGEVKVATVEKCESESQTETQ